MTIPSLKPSDLKPAPADGKLVRDATELFQKAPALVQMAMLAKLSTKRDTDATTAISAISAIFTDAVKAEEAAEDAKPARIPAGACRVIFGPDAKHFAYFSYSTAELFVG